MTSDAHAVSCDLVNIMKQRLDWLWSLAKTDEVREQIRALATEVDNLHALTFQQGRLAEALAQQRDMAVGEVRFLRQVSDEDARKRVAGALALEMDIGFDDALRVLELMLGLSDVRPAIFTERDLMVAIERAAEEMLEELIYLSDEYMEREA